MPCPLWRKMEEEKNGKTMATQGTLDGILVETTIVPVFARENILHTVTQFVAVDDQVRPVKS
jgi:hypothetical protein